MPHIGQHSFQYILQGAKRILSPNVNIVPLPDSIKVDKDVAIPMRDGKVLYADVYRPANSEEPCPVIMCAHPYQKDNLPKRGYLWNQLPIPFRVIRLPRPLTLSEGCGWEAPDPLYWVPLGYICVNMDLRGFGKSIKAGRGHIGSMEEAQDFFDAIEWIGTQPWCTGKVGLCGVSYLAISQYMVAGLRPPHLAAICPWEGLSDFYRDIARPGGVRDDGFMFFWSLELRNHLDEDIYESICAHETLDDWYKGKAPPELDGFKLITVPALVCMSYSDHGLHTNGSFRVFRRIASEYKWLYTHRDGKWNAFYSDEALALQLKFFDHFLKGEKDTGMLDVPRVRVEVRQTRDDVHSVLHFKDPIYPVKTTQWRALYMSGEKLSEQRITNTSTFSFDIQTGHASFSYTFDQDTIISGPMKATLFLSSSTLTDMNLFACIRKFDSAGNEVNFEGMVGWAYDVVARGWQRVGLRKPYPSYSEPWDCDKPFDEIQPLTPNKIEPVTIQLLPSATFFEKGSRLVFEARGRWYFPVGILTQGCNYEPTKEDGIVDLHCGGEQASTLLIGVLPPM
ncbi:hypothetical protein HK102_005509 [Quaeritorhiza haematococci]|nr:hypothetical protein HK102_005509 [Quaeritorhiza haematococci]